MGGGAIFGAETLLAQRDGVLDVEDAAGALEESETRFHGLCLSLVTRMGQGTEGPVRCNDRLRAV
jgi:hypothetical protein